MRTDEKGRPCPGTLGEYRDLCGAIDGGNCRALEILDVMIQGNPDGREGIVFSPDLSIRQLLMPSLTPFRYRPRATTRA
jgi:hypothetical protein